MLALQGQVAEAAIAARRGAVEMYVSLAAKHQQTEGSDAVSAYWREHAPFVAVRTQMENVPSRLNTDLEGPSRELSALVGKQTFAVSVE
jgi:hypothetical protein